MNYEKLGCEQATFHWHQLDIFGDDGTRHIFTDGNGNQCIHFFCADAGRDFGKTKCEK